MLKTFSQFTNPSFDIGDKVNIDSEGYCGHAFIHSWGRDDGVLVSADRSSKPFHVRMHAISKHK